MFPALRNIDAAAITHEGRRAVCVFDPQGLVETQLVLSPPAFYVATCLDGESGLEDLQRAFQAQFGESIAEEQVQAIVDVLDEHGFLDSDRFLSLIARLRADFDALPARPTHLAGRSYPADPDELRAFIAGFFARESAPAKGFACADPAAAPLPFLLVPHIDFERGATAYAHGYQALYRAGKPDVVFVFGVAHAGAPVPFVLTRKHFDTPLGTLQTDLALVDRLAAACDWDPFAHELVHRSEHSIEFQATMLAYLYGTEVRIVPILAAQLSENPFDTQPDNNPAVRRFLNECRSIAADAGLRVSVIAGADLAHVGKRFGDDFDIDDAVIAAVRARDDEDLAHVVASQGAAFYASVMRDTNARRVCGLGCLYAALKTVEDRVAISQVLHYGHAPDPAGGIVTFAAAAG